MPVEQINVTKRTDHNPKYLAEWSVGYNGYSQWFRTQKELLEYFRSWNAEIISTNFTLRGYHRFEVGDKVKLHFKPTRAMEEKIRQKYEGFVATVRSLGVIPTVKIKGNTNAGGWWLGVDYDEMEYVPESTPLSVIKGD